MNTYSRQWSKYNFSFSGKMEKVESALDVLSRAATMVQPCPAYPASDSDGFGEYLFSSMFSNFSTKTI